MSSPMTGRYVLPSYVERTSYGMKESNPYNKLVRGAHRLRRRAPDEIITSRKPG